MSEASLRPVLLTLITNTYFMINCNFEKHHHLSLHLEKAQVKNPLGVFAEFFSAYNLPECRLYLWQLLKWYGRAEKNEILLEHSDIFSFYEELICFVEAAHLVHREEQSKTEMDKVKTTLKGNDTIINLKDPLVRIINIIKNSIDVEKIFLLGSYPSQPVELGEEYDLLILVNDNHNRTNDEFESLIHNRSADTVPVNASVFKLSKVNEMILNGNYFFSTFCVPEKIIYDAGRIQLENPPAKHDLPINVFNQIHSGMMEKANGFLAGAVNFYDSKQFSLCGFMLHQAVEHGLNSLLQPLTQFRLHTHNLHKLMRITRRFSIEIFNFFPRDTDVEIRLFQLLQKAYIHARYKDTFELNEEDAEALLERIKLLLQKVEEKSKLLIKGIT